MSFKHLFSRSLSLAPGRLHFAAHSHHLWPDVSFEAQQTAWDDAARHADRKWDLVFGQVVPEAQAHVAAELGLPSPDSLVFAPNTHDFLVRLVSAVGRRPVRILSTDGEFHSFEHASILPRPTQPIPILFGGSAPALLDRCARLGDGWLPLGSPNEKSVDRIAEMRRVREAAGKSWDDFEIRAQAQWGGGTPERWQSHAQRWKDLGATHIAVATHNAGETDVDGHLARIAEYQAAIAGIA